MPVLLPVTRTLNDSGEIAQHDHDRDEPGEPIRPIAHSAEPAAAGVERVLSQAQRQVT